MSEHIHQQLNEQTRDALLAFCLTHVSGHDSSLPTAPTDGKPVTDDELQAWWLLDVQVSQAVPTSRVASAIASLQQYINAISLGLEPGYDIKGMSAAQQATWRDNLHAYSIWRAVQQLRHFPANYLSPMLRSHKSDSFEQLENDINQCRIEPDSVLPAIQRYLTRFEQVATLRTLNGYIDGNKDNFANSTYCFVARSNVDNTYYWRSLDMSRRSLPAGSSQGYKQDAPEPGAWSDWKKIPLPASENIPDHSLRPVYFNNRLFVVWAQCMSPTTVSGSAEYSWLEPDETEKDYKARLERYLKNRFIQFRLYFIYLKYDGTWSVPQLCSDEYCVMKELNKLDKEALKQATETVAVLDSTTHPPSLFLGLNAHASPLPAAGQKHTRSDFYQAVRIDQDFAIERLFSRGTVWDAPHTTEHENLAKRYLSQFVYSNTRRFNFHAPHSETVAVTGMATSTPDPVPDGWNFDKKHEHISELRDNSDIVFNKTSCVLEVTSRLSKPFEEHRSIAFKARTNWAELSLELNLSVPTPPANMTDKVALQTGSQLTLKTEVSPPCIWVSLAITCNKTGLSYSNLIYDAAQDPDGGPRPQQTLPIRRDWHVPLHNRFIEYDAFNFLFENTNTDYSITVHFHSLQNDTANPQNDWLFDNAEARLYARHYKRVIMIPRHQGTPHPANIHRGNSHLVGEPNTSRRELNGTFPSLDPAQPFNAHIQLNPRTLRPLDEQSGSGQGPITIIHGVLIYDTDTRHHDRMIRGYALKALQLTLDPANAAPVITLAPGISRSRVQAEGTAEYIDFSGSRIHFSDDAQARQPRAPIRMNTGVGRQLSAAANVSLDHLFATTVSQWHEPGMGNRAAPQPLDFHGAHGKYFWELFLYLPWLVACRLNMEQRYAEAEAWLRHIFDPQGQRAHRQHWRLPVLHADPPDPSYALDNPDDPHQIALSTPLHFRQALYMLYLDILLNRGDAAFRQASSDSLAEAKLWYLRVKSLLGPRPDITRSDPWEPRTLHELATEPASTLCRPLNPQLLTRWDKIESRLYNLRHHLDINARPLQQPLFAPALQAHTLLSRYARGGGASGAAHPAAPATDIGHYRFQTIQAHAMSLVDNVIQLGNTLLLLFERKEQSEHLQLQQQQAWDLARIAVDQQRQGLLADASSHDALLAGRRVIEGRMQYFQGLLKEKISATEAQATQHYLESAQWDTVASVAQAGAGLAMLAPNIFGTSNGGMRYEGAFHAVQAGAQSVANEKRASAGHLDRTSLFNRRAQEWAQALEQCTLELHQVDMQLQAHIQQSAALRLQLRYSETALDQARQTYELLSRRFGNAQLYQWLNSQLAALYYQAYDVAHALCLTAQACWQFERADWDTRFIRSGTWNNHFKGMIAGETLKLDLQHMLAAYLQRNRRELQISKTVSLRLLRAKDRSGTVNQDWAEMHKSLLDKGSVAFELTQALFDDDYPGHYLRRIKNISVSLPATLGPYEDIRATLTQTSSKIQLSATSSDTRDDLRVREQVVLSTGLNDSGLFTLNFDSDERYLPFEYTGAVSTWLLAFPMHMAQLPMLNSLSDIIVHIRYTAQSAGGQK
jgi:hypothetical protein